MFLSRSTSSNGGGGSEKSECSSLNISAMKAYGAIQVAFYQRNANWDAMRRYHSYLIRSLCLWLLVSQSGCMSFTHHVDYRVDAAKSLKKEFVEDFDSTNATMHAGAYVGTF